MAFPIFFLLLSMGQSASQAGLPGDPAENYREAVACYGVFASTATLHRISNDEPNALQADAKARAFMGLASLSARDAGVSRETLVEGLQQSPLAAIEPLRGETDEAAITAFVERLNVRADECIAFVNNRTNGTRSVGASLSFSAH